MDIMTVRNFLKNPKLRTHVLAPLLYPQDTCDVICDVVEAAMRAKESGMKESKMRNLSKCVRRLEKLK